MKKGGGFVKGTSLSRDAEWGIASETIQKAAKAVVDKFTTGEYLARVTSAATPAGGLEGKIIKVEGNKAYINLGASSGIKMGDKFNVISVGEALIDPDTGAKLGASEKQTGNGAVVEVQDKFAPSFTPVSGSISASPTLNTLNLSPTFNAGGGAQVDPGLVAVDLDDLALEPARRRRGVVTRAR